MGFFSSSPRKNTKGMQIRKLKSKIARKEKKLKQSNELNALRKKWESIRSK